MYCGWTVRTRAKVTIDRKLHMRSQLVGAKMNDPLDLCLQVVSRSCKPLRYIRHWISRKPLEIDTPLQGTTNTKWSMWNQMVTWPMTSRDPERTNSWPQYPQSIISQKQPEILFRNNQYLLDSLLFGGTVDYPVTAWLLGLLAPHPYWHHW